MAALLAGIDRMRRHLAYLRERDEARLAGPGALLGDSPLIREARATIEEMAAAPDPVLVEGERGVGKRLAAALLHYRGPRRAALLVVRSAGPTVAGQFEEDLRGAATRPGLIDLASGGTLLLRDVDGLPAALLEDLQAAARTADARFVLVVPAGAVDDLRRRLGAAVLRLPPLRDRREDIPLLARSFAERLADDLGLPADVPDADELRGFVARRWPGNVRELETAVARLAFQRLLAAEAETGARESASDGGTLHAMMERYERKLIGDALRETAGNKTHAAAALGITREGLHKKLARYRDEI